MATSDDLTDIERRAIAYLKSGRGRKASDVGWHLWGENGYHGSKCSCPFARPAGKLLRRLERKKKATAIDDREYGTLWY